jgi:two-component system, OmpR family, KDP operon response regulator KdpE
MTTTGPKVLVVEDEWQIRRFVRAAMEDDGCVVLEAETAAQGLAIAAEAKPDLLVLDLGLPDRDGVDLIGDLRRWSDVPVIILSARADEDEKVKALDAGADDYLTKPFGVGELLARTRALLRRPRSTDGQRSPVIEFGKLRVDLVRRVVERDGKPVHLTPIEYRLLAVLIANSNRVLTHRHLLADVWGPGYADSAHYLRVYIAHLRDKLEDDATRPRHIVTETGVGYRFQP